MIPVPVHEPTASLWHAGERDQLLFVCQRARKLVDRC